MTAHVLTGSKHEIAHQIADMAGDVCEAIVFVAEVRPQAPASEDIFAEMERLTVQRASVDDSRDAVYERQVAE